MEKERMEHKKNVEELNLKIRNVEKEVYNAKAERNY